jgi:hypothetical protein
MSQPKTKIVIAMARTTTARRDLDVRPSQADMPEERSHSPTWVGSGDGIKRLRLRKSLDSDEEDSSDLEPWSGSEDSEEFSEYRPTTDSKYSSDEYDKTPDPQL